MEFILSSTLNETFSSYITNTFVMYYVPKMFFQPKYRFRNDP